MGRSGYTLCINVFHTAFGWAGVAVTDLGVYRVVLPMKDRKAVARDIQDLEGDCPMADGSRSIKILARAVTLMRDYFAGKSVLFDLPIDLRYYTFFQQDVWKAAQSIPHGETRSYGWVAGRIKRPGAARAVGTALGINPVPLFIP